MGKGKKGGGRGSGKKMYIANVEELQMREQAIGDEREERLRRRGEDNSGDEQADDNDGDENPDNTVFQFERKSRAELVAEREAAKQSGANNKPKGDKAKNTDDSEISADPEGGLNRKQREVLAAERAKEEAARRYRAGETEQARKDLERLALVRARREAAAKEREKLGKPPGWKSSEAANTNDEDSEEGSSEESSDESDNEQQNNRKSDGKKTGPSASAAAHAKAQQEAAAAVAAKKKAAALGESSETVAGDGGPPKLKNMDIKKMNGDALKEHLKARGLNVQGQKKDLIKRLCDYEAAR